MQKSLRVEKNSVLSIFTKFMFSGGFHCVDFWAYPKLLGY